VSNDQLRGRAPALIPPGPAARHLVRRLLGGPLPRFSAWAYRDEQFAVAKQHAFVSAAKKLLELGLAVRPQPGVYELTEAGRAAAALEGIANGHAEEGSDAR